MKKKYFNLKNQIFIIIFFFKILNFEKLHVLIINFVYTLDFLKFFSRNEKK